MVGYSTDPLWCPSVSQIPKHNDWTFVILRRGDQSGRLRCQLTVLTEIAARLTCSGCQQTSLIPLLLPTCNPAPPATASLPLAAPPPYCKLTISLPAFKSQTEVYPEDEEAARIRETVGFHWREVISPSLLETGPGVTGSLVGLFRS